jgi:predicted dehydrogenase
MVEKLKLGLVGAGAISQTHVQAMPLVECAEIVGVADVRPEAAKATAEGLGARSFTSHEAMSQSLDLDGVIICTPPSSHPEIAIHFLQQGVSVLCEKPLAIDSASARLMLEAAEKAGATLMMASKFRYVEDVIHAKSILASGVLGEITLFENAFTSRVDMSHRWNSDPKVSGGGVLIDNGTHSVDLMRYFVGPLAELQVWEGRRSQGLAVDETVRVFVRNASGVMGTIDLSWTINKELGHYFNIYGSQGTISVGWKESKYKIASSRDWVVFGKGYDKLQALSAQLRNFCGVVRKEEAPLTAPEDALASVEVIEAAYEALRENRWQPVANGKSAVHVR